MKYLTLFFTVACLQLSAQLPGNFDALRTIHTDTTMVQRELATGLVRVGLTDSILPTKTATHQTRLFNWALRTFAGLRWRAIDGKKHKMVGTMRGGLSSPGKDFFTEYDITFQTFQHTPEYQELVRIAYKAQYDKMLKGRNHLIKRGINPDSLNTDQLTKLRIHPEHTPLKASRAALNEKFLPCIQGTSIDNHPAWGVQNPTVGCYGAFVLDGNHKGSPEIHPYEWLWWMDAREKRPNVVKWYAGLMREGSNRFLRWSKKPRIGYIAIPFVFDVTNDTNQIKVEHLVKGDFKPKGMGKLGAFIPTNASKFEGTKDVVFINEQTRKPYTITLITEAVNTDALKWWITIENETGNLISGYMYVAVSVDDAYCFSVTVED